MSVVALPVNAVVATVPVGDRPFGTAVSPDGTRAYVTNYASDTVSVLGTAVDAVVGTVVVGDSPSAVVITPDGTRAYVSNYDGDSVSVVAIEP